MLLGIAKSDVLLDGFADAVVFCVLGTTFKSFRIRRLALEGRIKSQGASLEQRANETTVI
jgi:hypothetical protein